MPGGDLDEVDSKLSTWVDEDTPERAVLDQEQARLDSERDRRIWSVFGTLPERCARLLRVLIASPPPSYAEIAEALDLPIGSIGPTRMRCLRMLRDRLAGIGITGHPSRS